MKHTWRLIIVVAALLQVGKMFKIDQYVDHTDIAYRKKYVQFINYEGVWTHKGIYTTAGLPYTVNLTEIKEVYYAMDGLSITHVIRPFYSEFEYSLKGADQSGNPSQLLSLKCRAYKATFNDKPSADLGPVCANTSHIYISLTLYKPSTAQLYIWTPTLQNSIKQTIDIEGQPSHLALIFNGFMQSTHIYTEDGYGLKPRTYNCPKGCAKCSYPGHCSKCGFGYYGVRGMNDGYYCVESQTKGWTLIIVTIATLIYLYRKCFPSTKTLTFICHNHKDEYVTTVAVPCGHMFCEKCTGGDRLLKEKTSCFICKRDISQLLPINID